MVSNGRDIIRQGYAEGRPVSVIARDCASTPGSVRVTAYRMGVRHTVYAPLKVPADKQGDYQHLTQRKRLPAAYVRRVLGLEAGV